MPIAAEQAAALEAAHDLLDDRRGPAAREEGQGGAERGRCSASFHASEIVRGDGLAHDRVIDVDGLRREADQAGHDGPHRRAVEDADGDARCPRLRLRTRPRGGASGLALATLGSRGASAPPPRPVDR
jgi:hypothetical protein